MEQLGEILKALMETGTLQKDQQSQLSWTTGSFKRLSHQPNSIHEEDQVPPTPTYIADLQLSLYVCPPTTGAEAFP